MVRRIRHFGPDKRIPYVAAWSSEQTVVIRHDPIVGGPAAFRSDGKQGEGRPVLGKMDESRQRECVVKGLCQVCHRKIQGPGICSPDAVERHITGVGKGYLVTEPLVCEPCFAVALRFCPAQRARAETSQPFACRVRSYSMVLQLLDPNHPDFADVKGNDGRPFVGYVRYMPKPKRFDWLKPAEITALANLELQREAS